MAEKMTAEEILATIFSFFIKKPKGIIALLSILVVVFGIFYYSFMKAQNDMLKDAIKVLSESSKLSETIKTTVTNLTKKAEEATKIIEERTARLDEVEKKFQAKRQEIIKLRSEQDELLAELQTKVKEANDKLDRIDEQQNKSQQTLKQIENVQKEVVIQQKMLETPDKIFRDMTVPK